MTSRTWSAGSLLWIVVAGAVLPACSTTPAGADSAPDTSATDTVRVDREDVIPVDVTAMDAVEDATPAIDSSAESAVESGADAGCPIGQQSCSDRCVDTQSDSMHCGACGAACPMGHGCVAGECRIDCPAPRTRCVVGAMMSCVDTQTDVLNCGACGTACAIANGTASCAAGSCAVAACNAGFADCDSMPSNGCETSTNDSVANCGGCARACGPIANATAACAAGSCTVGMCNAGFGDCDANRANGCEVPLNSVSHCGACAVTCPARPNATASCSSMTCGSTCDVGFSNCDGNAVNGCETSVATDVNNCGACANVCGAGRVCRGGTCAMANRVLISDGFGSATLRGFLVGWGYTVTIVSGAALVSTFDYSRYDIVAFMFNSTIADPARLIAENVAGRVGIVLHRGDSLLASFGMGATGLWQSGPFAVTNNSHYVTSPFAVGAVDVRYTYKSVVNSPAAATRVLGTATGASLVVHNTFRRIVTPYYGHTDGMPWSAAGETLTRRSYEWAGGLGAQ